MLVNVNPKNVPYYESVEQFTRDDNCLEIDVQIVGLPGMFRIRALTFEQMENINKNSTIDGMLDSKEFTYNTIVEGVTRPKFTKQNVRQLAEMNGEIVRELSDQIWRLGRITKETFDAYIKAIEAK